MHALGWAAVATLAAVLSINAAFMLVSPKAWFRLPSWILAKGSMTEKKYASGLGAVQVRITGGLTLGVIGWVLYDLLSKR